MNWYASPPTLVAIPTMFSLIILNTTSLCARRSSRASAIRPTVPALHRVRWLRAPEPVQLRLERPAAPARDQTRPGEHRFRQPQHETRKPKREPVGSRRRPRHFRQDAGSSNQAAAAAGPAGPRVNPTTAPRADRIVHRSRLWRPALPSRNDKSLDVTFQRPYPAGTARPTIARLRMTLIPMLVKVTEH